MQCSTSTCHFERNAVQPKNLKTLVYATTRYFGYAQYDTVVAGITTQPLLCHFERSKAKPKNLKTLVYATTRYFDYAQYDPVVASITALASTCHFERSEAKSKNLITLVHATKFYKIAPKTIWLNRTKIKNYIKIFIIF